MADAHDDHRSKDSWDELRMTRAYEIIEHSYDVVIIGAGGAGLRAALGMDAADDAAPLCRLPRWPAA